jgi:hypothetical protein
MRFRDRELSQNNLMNSIDTKFDNFKHYNGIVLQSYTAKMIRDIILGSDQKATPKIIEYVQKYYDRAIRFNLQITEGTKRNYRKAIKHLFEFLKYRKSGTANLKEVNMSFAYAFRDHLLTITIPGGQPGMKEQSALDNWSFLSFLDEFG